MVDAREWLAGMLDAEKCDAGSVLWALGGRMANVREEMWGADEHGPAMLSRLTTRDWTFGDTVIRENRLFADAQQVARLALALGVGACLDGTTDVERMVPVHMAAKVVRAAQLTPEAIEHFSAVLLENANG